MRVGGVDLNQKLMLAAGVIKGEGWQQALDRVGIAEFGSYTPFPMEGTPGGTVKFIDGGKTTINNIGLKNAGAIIAGEYWGKC